MFNAAFLSEQVEKQTALEARLRAAKEHFDSNSLRWALWICEDWIATGLRRRLSRTCENLGLRLSSEMPGMAADRIRPPSRNLPVIEFRRVDSTQTLDCFRALGATCFHVPISWFSEVFDAAITANHPFVCWVGYLDRQPVATAATVSAFSAASSSSMSRSTIDMPPASGRNGARYEGRSVAASVPKSRP